MKAKPAHILIATYFFLLACDLGLKNEQYISEFCTEVFTVVENPPVLIGGIASIQSQIIYPELAIRAEIEGRVVTQFIVNKKGDVIEPRVISGIGGGADEEALRVTKLATFEPGSNQGIAVCTQYALPISFSLPD